MPGTPSPGPIPRTATTPDVPGLGGGEPEKEAAELDAAGRGQLPGLSAEGEPGTAKPMFRMDRNITDVKELEEAPEGVFQTPQGTVEKMAGGKLKVKELSPEAKVKIEGIKQQQIAQFGDYPGRDDPDGPPPPVEPGQPWFNPFTGQWGNGGGPDEVSYMDEGVD